MGEKYEEFLKLLVKLRIARESKGWILIKSDEGTSLLRSSPI